MADGLAAKYQTMAAGGGNLLGLSVLKYADDIGTIIRDAGAVTLLDYGSGRGDAYQEPHCIHERWGVPEPALYDPAFPELAGIESALYDGVICSDVLEHVPEQETGGVVRDLFAHARLFVWASVCCRPAKKCFPDGSNLHATVRPYEWWRELFAANASGVRWALVETP